MNFSDLQFNPHPNWEGVQAKHFFPNGYGVSVIQSPNSYGGDDGLYELAVLKGDETNSKITYDTPITRDVIGYLTEDEVTELLTQVSSL